MSGREYTRNQEKSTLQLLYCGQRFVIASALPWHRPPPPSVPRARWCETAGQVCEAISSTKQGIALTEDRRLAMTLSKFRIAGLTALRLTKL